MSGEDEVGARSSGDGFFGQRWSLSGVSDGIPVELQRRKGTRMHLSDGMSGSLAEGQ